MTQPMRGEDSVIVCLMPTKDTKVWSPNRPQVQFTKHSRHVGSPALAGNIGKSVVCQGAQPQADPCSRAPRIHGSTLRRCKKMPRQDFVLKLSDFDRCSSECAELATFFDVFASWPCCAENWRHGRGRRVESFGGCSGVTTLCCCQDQRKKQNMNLGRNSADKALCTGKRILCPLPPTTLARNFVTTLLKDDVPC